MWEILIGAINAIATFAAIVVSLFLASRPYRLRINAQGVPISQYSKYGWSQDLSRDELNRPVALRVRVTNIGVISFPIKAIYLRKTRFGRYYPMNLTKPETFEIEPITTGNAKEFEFDLIKLRLNDEDVPKHIISLKDAVTKKSEIFLFIDRMLPCVYNLYVIDVTEKWHRVKIKRKYKRHITKILNKTFYGE